MFNREDFAIFVPAAEFLGAKLRETNKMDISYNRKRERMRGFCKRRGVTFIKINEDCTHLYTRIKMHTTSAKMDIKLRNPGILINITEEDEPNTAQ